MKLRQILSSGLWIEQDLSAAVRPALFQTDFEEFLYATHGGTLFVVSFKGRPYALTCRHIFKDFEFERLFIGADKVAQKGAKPAILKGQCYPSSPRDGAVDSDVLDLCVIEFAENVDTGFFNGAAYIIDPKTIATSEQGDRLRVFGVLKEKTLIDPPNIDIGYCNLEFCDTGVPGSDPVIRTAKAKFLYPGFGGIVGISGSPVLNETANVLCGMVVRGGMTGSECTMYYIDIMDITALLEGVDRRASNLSYSKPSPFARG
jgi:hypothetical protein